jgi:hypothetical protein
MLGGDLRKGHTGRFLRSVCSICFWSNSSFFSSAPVRDKDKRRERDTFQDREGPPSKVIVTSIIMDTYQQSIKWYLLLIYCHARDLAQVEMVKVDKLLDSSSFLSLESPNSL